VNDDIGWILISTTPDESGWLLAECITAVGTPAFMLIDPQAADQCVHDVYAPHESYGPLPAEWRKRIDSGQVSA